MKRIVVVAALLAGAPLVPAGLAGQDLGAPDVPFVESPMPVVETMLELAAPAAGDTLYDLGSGDGRIPILAAGRYGVSSVGVEIQDSLVRLSRRNARLAGVEERVRFVHGDLFETDLRPASVVTLYLLWSLNIRLRPKLLRELRPGARIVSHQFRMGEWRPDSTVQIPRHVAHVYSWTVPADVEGTWRLTTAAGEELALEIDQKFQELRVEAVAGAEPVGVRDAVLRGEGIEIALEAAGSGASPVRRFTGTVTDGRMEGRTASGGAWSAVRVAGAGDPIDAWDGETEPDSLPDPAQPPCCPPGDTARAPGMASSTPSPMPSSTPPPMPSLTPGFAAAYLWVGGGWAP